MARFPRRLLGNLLLSLASLIIGFILVEMGYRVYVVIRQPVPGIKYTPDDIWTRYDPVTGWRHIPAAVVKDVIINEHGFRVGREEEIKKSIGEKVISALGDSFTFGYGVEGEAAWPARLEKLFPDRRYDVINMGVCAYGIDQMYLHYLHRARKYSPEIVLVAFMSWDIERVVRDSWLNGRAKPRYVLEDGELRLSNVPVPLKLDFDREQMRWHDILFDRRKLYLFERFRGSKEPDDRSRNPVEAYLAERITPGRYAEGVLLSQKILEGWRKEVEGRGGRFVVILIPTRDELDCYRPALSILRDNLRDKGIEVLDCRGAFQKMRAKGEKLFLTNKHPTAKAHETIASEVFCYLFSGSWDD